MENLKGFVAQVSKALSSDQQTADGNQRALEKAIASKDVKISRMLDQIEDGAGNAVLLLERLDQRQAEREALVADLDALMHKTQEPFVMPDLPAA